MPCWPLPGSRVNATPVPESMPRLPNTMATMFTAVPRSAGMRSWRRYRMARSAFHELNTALTAMSICSRGACGKSWPVCSRTIPLNRVHDRVQVGGVQVQVVLGALGLLGLLHHVLEGLAVDAEHGLAEHLDQAAVGVPGEPVAAGLLGQPVHGLVGQADVQHCLHHPGHRELGPGPHADQQRVGRVAELAAHGLLQRGQVLADLGVQAVGHGAVVQVLAACLGGNDETGRDGQAEVGHLSQVGSLAAQQVFEVLVALGEVINELRH